MIKIKDKHIEDIISKIPFDPGIYMMKDENGKIIYVGKAISLKKRVRQYFQKNNKSKRIENMVSLVRDIAYIVTKNEVEALVLECNYIKENSPKFNVLLKDDKTYPYIKITVKDKYPLIYVTRTKKDDKAMYFGPYTNVSAMRDTLFTLKQIFPIKRCKYNLEKTRVSPCLYYHIGRCLGPCVNDINRKQYSQMIEQVIMFLQGKTKQVKDILKEQIDECIIKLEFEKAQELKERIENIKKTMLKQEVANLNENSTDIFGYVYNLEKLYIQIFKIRDYKIVLHDNIVINEILNEEAEESLIQIISQYYTKNENMPKKIYAKVSDKNLELLNDFFLNKNIKLEIFSPKKGEKLKLINMVENNIHINIEDKKNNAIEELANLLEFANGIDSIECYDISNLRNDYIVGCMIRFEDGKLNKKMYRKFKIKSTLTQDDPKCIYEILSRRIKHKIDWPLPDVIFIDGGKTQLNMAKEALKESNENISIYGMVKNDKHKTKGLLDENGKDINIEENKKILNFVTFLQDEIHRFTINYHRSLRDKINKK